MEEENVNDTENDASIERKVTPFTKPEINSNCPIADEDNTCSMGDLIELFNGFHKLAKLKLKSTVGFRLNVNTGKLKNTIKAYQIERDKLIEEHGIKSKITGKKEIPITDKGMNEEEKNTFYKCLTVFTVGAEELMYRREPIPKDMRNFYINEDNSDFPEASGALPVHFKVLQDFGLVHEGEDPNIPKPKK